MKNEKIEKQKKKKKKLDKRPQSKNQQSFGVPLLLQTQVAQQGQEAYLVETPYLNKEKRDKRKTEGRRK